MLKIQRSTNLKCMILLFVVYRTCPLYNPKIQRSQNSHHILLLFGEHFSKFQRCMLKVQGSEYSIRKLLLVSANPNILQKSILILQRNCNSYHMFHLVTYVYPEQLQHAAR